MRPLLDLAQVYGPEIVYNGNASYAWPGWTQGGRETRDFRTGDHLAIAGDVGYVIARAASAGPGLRLLLDTGLGLPPRRLVYDGEESYRRLLDAVRETMVVQHVHPAGEIARTWISRELLSFLNNKRNYAEVIPERFLPRRRLLPRRDVATLSAPVAVKAATDLSSGGGRDVRLCRTTLELEAAAHYFRSVEEVVAEEWLRFDESICIQYAALRDGSVRYLGFSRQVVSPEGRYLGNLFDLEADPPPSSVEAGRVIMERAVALGWRGIAGFDMASCADGSLKVFDLNFRLNGSTGPLLLSRAIAERLGSPRFRYRSWAGEEGFTQMLRWARERMESRDLVPLATYDPTESASPHDHPRISGCEPIA
jgi:hypothetical protein